MECELGGDGQTKRGHNVEMAPGRKAKVREVPLTTPKRLRNVGSHKEGVTLDELKKLAPDVTEDYVKVFVKVDRPLPGLAPGGVVTPARHQVWGRSRSRLSGPLI